MKTKKIFIKTQGCQMNEYDSMKVLDLMREQEKFEEHSRFLEFRKYGNNFFSFFDFFNWNGFFSFKVEQTPYRKH